MIYFSIVTRFANMLTTTIRDITKFSEHNVTVKLSDEFKDTRKGHRGQKHEHHSSHTSLLQLDQFVSKQDKIIASPSNMCYISVLHV